MAIFPYFYCFTIRSLIRGLRESAESIFVCLELRWNFFVVKDKKFSIFECLKTVIALINANFFSSYICANRKTANGDLSWLRR